MTNEILLVHDHQSSADLRKSALERAGWVVRATSSADECLVRARARLPALVLLDVLIDGRTGFDLCRLLRERHTAAELPIVLGCHVYQGAEHEAEAERAGAQAWLSLPVEPEDLLSLVASLTRERHGVRAA